MSGATAGGAPLLKVCGLREAATAEAIAPLEIDYIGFVFAPSKRRVGAAEAADIMAAARRSGGRQRFAGVFVDPSMEQLEAVMAAAPLDVIQLHGAEPAAFVRQCRGRFPGVRVWKAVGADDGSLPDGAGHAEPGGDAARQAAGRTNRTAERLEPYAGLLDALLLDAHDPLARGGTGRTFRWEAIPAYEAWTTRQGIPLFIAGGLHPDNVGELLASYGGGPLRGVDVSSGVETNGAKDPEKIRLFVERVKRR